MIEALQTIPHGGYSIVFPKMKPPLHAMLTGCGFNEERDHLYRWHGLERGGVEFAIWQYTISGEGAIHNGDETRVLTPGDAMMVHIPHDHCYFLPESSPRWEFLYVSLNGREIMRLWHEMEAVSGPVFNFADDSPTVRMAAEIFKMRRSGRIATPRQASGLAYGFMMTLLDEVRPDAAFGGGGGEKPEFIRRVVEYALANAHKPIGVEELAAKAGLGRFHFSRKFAQWYGVPPSVFLREIRVERAVRLLQTERLTIKEVAERCGFADASYFCKVFRKAMGVSPEAFRKGSA